MISAVLDTNTIVSAILVRQGIPNRLLAAAYSRAFACISSSVIVAEVVRTLTDDRQLLALGRYQGTAIISPREFLAILESQTPVSDV